LPEPLYAMIKKPIEKSGDYRSVDELCREASRSLIGRYRLKEGEF